MPLSESCIVLNKRVVVTGFLLTIEREQKITTVLQRELPWLRSAFVVDTHVPRQFTVLIDAGRKLQSATSEEQEEMYTEVVAKTLVCVGSSIEEVQPEFKL